MNRHNYYSSTILQKIIRGFENRHAIQTAVIGALVSPHYMLNVELIRSLYQAPYFPIILLLKALRSPEVLVKNALLMLIEAKVIGQDSNQSTQQVLPLLEDFCDRADNPAIQSKLIAISQLNNSSQLTACCRK